MINDGYSLKGTLRERGSSIRVVVRPATQRERSHFKDVVLTIGQKSGHIAICQWLSEHVVLSDIQSLVEHPAWVSVDRFSKDHEPMFSQLWLLINGLVKDSNGKTWVEQESRLARNLREGVILERTNPKLARRSCVNCQRDWYNESSGDPIIVTSTGLPMLREGPTMCQTKEGCAKGTPEHQKSLCRRNRKAYRHYLECEASSFPDDPIVKQNALIISSALRSKVRK